MPFWVMKYGILQYFYKTKNNLLQSKRICQVNKSLLLFHDVQLGFFVLIKHAKSAKNDNWPNDCRRPPDGIKNNRHAD